MDEQKKRARANLKAKGRVHPKFDTRLAPTAEDWRDEKREQDAQYRIWKLSIQVEEAVNAKGWIAWQ